MVHILAGQTEIQEDYETEKSNNYNIWQKSEKSDSLRTADDASSGMQGHAVVKISKCCKKLQTKKQTLIWTCGIFLFQRKN